MPFHFHEAFLKLPDGVVHEHIYKPLFAENFPVIRTVEIQEIVLCPVKFPHADLTCERCYVIYNYNWLNKPPETGWGNLNYNSKNINKSC